MYNRAVIVGASGGIGSALARELHVRSPTTEVFALARDPHQLDLAFAVPVRCDVADEISIRVAAAEVVRHGAVDLVIVASGTLAPPGSGPERSLRTFDATTALEMMAVNAIGPALVAKHFLPSFPRDTRAVFAALSARVGSISDNGLGGWHSYRASKAALNMLVRGAAIELGRTHRQAIAVTFHPGTVDTALSAPFQRGVAPERLFSPHQSAGYLLDVIAGLTTAQSGTCLAWDGTAIPF
jgi:NAD(P)-dependent dehydrogenase (short-subunit alcohol dehydrogenase family)